MCKLRNMINSILAQNFALLEKVDQNFAILLLSKYSSKKSKKKYNKLKNFLFLTIFFLFAREFFDSCSDCFMIAHRQTICEMLAYLNCWE